LAALEVVPTDKLPEPQCRRALAGGGSAGCGEAAARDGASGAEPSESAGCYSGHSQLDVPLPNRTAQRSVAIAEGRVVRVRVAYAKTLIQYEQATGTLLEKNNIEMLEALDGVVKDRQ